jgi:putative two-component system response regulator
MDTEFNGRLSAPVILVADNSLGRLRLMCDILMEKYWVVRPVLNCADVMTEVMRSPPDLIILDALFPDADGYEVCAKLKRNPATGDIPVMIATTFEDHESRIRGLQAGAADFFSRSASVTEIQDRVLRLLQMKKLRYLQQDQCKKPEQQLLERRKP